MSENTTQIEQALRGSHDRLRALAERATRLRAKLEADTSLLLSMERLAEEARQASPPARPEPSDYPQDDGFYLADGWEIALINEEGD